MLRVNSKFRLVIVVLLAMAGLLLPTLHFHLGEPHAHDAHGAHRHGIVHADFLAALASGHGEHADGRHHGADSELPTEGVALLALTSSRIELAALPFQEQLLLPEDTELPRIVILFRRGIIKHQSPPHSLEVHRLASPRSPPRSI